MQLRIWIISTWIYIVMLYMGFCHGKTGWNSPPKHPSCLMAKKLMFPGCGWPSLSSKMYLRGSSKSLLMTGFSKPHSSLAPFSSHLLGLRNRIPYFARNCSLQTIKQSDLGLQVQPWCERENVPNTCSQYGALMLTICLTKTPLPTHPRRVFLIRGYPFIHNAIGPSWSLHS